MSYLAELPSEDPNYNMIHWIRDAVDPSYHYWLTDFVSYLQHPLYHYSVGKLLPENLHLEAVHQCTGFNPGIREIDEALNLARAEDIIFCAPGNLLQQIDSLGESLLTLKSKGHDIRMVFSAEDCLQIAALFPEREVIYWSFGFEMALCDTAKAILKAMQHEIRNFHVLVQHQSSMQWVLQRLQQCEQGKQQGPICHGVLVPSLTSLCLDESPYQGLAAKYKKPIVACGYRLGDYLAGVKILLQQIRQGSHDFVDQSLRVMNDPMNRQLQAMICKVFAAEYLEMKGSVSLAYKINLQANCQQFDARELFAEIKHAYIDSTMKVGVV